MKITHKRVEKVFVERKVPPGACNATAMLIARRPPVSQ